MRVLSCLAIAGLAALAIASVAAAHSLLLESTPAAGATLPAAPRELRLRFNNRIEKPLSRVRLVDSRGAAQTITLTTEGVAPDWLRGPLPPLAPGRWRVEWQVLSTDGHVVSGRFEFQIAP
ncbi:MAG TPA: copper resistance CopC family protein [Candidatus Binatia bacterium]|nr:copper resistance CopC family protein [Candidatus Binatia bacterium]